MSYQSDRQWSDQFIPQIKRIVGPYLLEPAPLEVDTKQAADLIILRARDMTIAARVRRHGYADNYPYEFTLRSRRDSGSKTEMSKITDGWGDWMFYGHEEHPNNGKLGRWFLVDLHAWRAHFIREGQRTRKSIVHGEKSNGDGTSFCWFDLTSFQSYPPILIAASHEVPNAQRASA